jgi:hypothetical protein
LTYEFLFELVGLYGDVSQVVVGTSEGVVAGRFEFAQSSGSIGELGVGRDHLDVFGNQIAGHLGHQVHLFGQLANVGLFVLKVRINFGGRVASHN